jgi:hypothetical protein
MEKRLPSGGKPKKEAIKKTFQHYFLSLRKRFFFKVTWFCILYPRLRKALGFPRTSSA